jgi:hypothetical protein
LELVLALREKEKIRSALELLPQKHPQRKMAQQMLQLLY